MIIANSSVDYETQLDQVKGLKDGCREGSFNSISSTSTVVYIAVIILSAILKALLRTEITSLSHVPFTSPSYNPLHTSQ